jgi:hypothetical protein
MYKTYLQAFAFDSLLLQSNTNDIIKLNVGGTLFTTTRQTLTKYIGSRLAEMFDPSLGTAPPMDSTGAFFIDRSPEEFGVSLKYLRTGR